jgi:hypothetical protein
MGLVTATQSNEEFGDTKSLQEKSVSGVEEDTESLKDIEILLLLLKNRCLVSIITCRLEIENPSFLHYNIRMLINPDNI